MSLLDKLRSFFSKSPKAMEPPPVPPTPVATPAASASPSPKPAVKRTRKRAMSAPAIQTKAK